jgi:hypothetical protein
LGNRFGGFRKERAHRSRGFHCSALLPEGETAVGRRPVVGVDSPRFTKVARAQAYVEVGMVGAGRGLRWLAPVMTSRWTKRMAHQCFGASPRWTAARRLAPAWWRRGA